MNALPAIATATLPASYEQAKAALATCERIDECRTWADKAMALASYAKQADDDTLHRLATRISARAVRRCGELLKTFQNERARTDLVAGAHDQTQRRAAQQAGMSPHQELQAVRVANVPADEFEAAVEADHPASVTRLAEIGKNARPTPPGFRAATHALGTVKDFAAFCDAHEPKFVADGVYGYEIPKLRAHVATIEAWLVAFVAHLDPEATC